MTEIHPVTPSDIPACAALLMDAYNREPWCDGWTAESGSRYLSEFLDIKRFQGFLLLYDGAPAGAVFGHGRAWWTGDEFFVNEFFIASALQRRGLGGALLRRVEEYVLSQRMNGITLLTNRHFPARDFYLKNGFAEAEHVLFMYKVLGDR